jgi:hypothetical protein
MSQSQDDKRRDEVLKRMLATPVKKQAQLKEELKKGRDAKPAKSK